VLAELAVGQLQPASAQQRPQRVLPEHPAEPERDARPQYRAAQRGPEPQLRAEEGARREVEERSGHEGDRAQPVRHREHHGRRGTVQLWRPAVGQQLLRLEEQHGRGRGHQQRHEQGQPGPRREQRSRAARGKTRGRGGELGGGELGGTELRGDGRGSGRRGAPRAGGGIEHPATLTDRHV
jgi:hypothetical protein